MELTKKQQIELDKLKAKFKKENESIKLTFTDESTQLYHESDTFFWIKSDNLADLKYLLSVLPANKELVNAGNEHVSESNFAVSLENPCVQNSCNSFQIHVIYKHKNTSVRVKFPIKFVDDHISCTERNLYDTEYGHFTGYSYRKLNEIRVPRYVFKDTEKTINWHGGDQTSLKKQVIEEILSTLGIDLNE